MSVLCCVDSMFFKFCHNFFLLCNYGGACIIKACNSLRIPSGLVRSSYLVFRELRVPLIKLKVWLISCMVSLLTFSRSFLTLSISLRIRVLCACISFCMKEVIFVVVSSSMFLGGSGVVGWGISVGGGKVGFCGLGIVGLGGSNVEMMFLTLGVCMEVMGEGFIGVDVPLGKILGFCKFGLLGDMNKVWGS